MGFDMLLPILIIVISNTAYNVAAKLTSSEINPFASLTATYFVGMAVSLIIFKISSPSQHFLTELSKANWATYALGLAIVGLEGGFILAYRRGWQVNTTQLVTSIAVTCILLIVGYLFFKEGLTLRQGIGILLCMAGLFVAFF